MAARRATTDWLSLVVASGLAVTITAVGTYLTDRSRGLADARLRRCEIANTFLSDEAPTPYMDERTRQSVTRTAAAMLERCLKER